MLNSNLKSDIQKNVWVKRLKTKKSQTEFNRVPTLVFYLHLLYGWILSHIELFEIAHSLVKQYPQDAVQFAYYC
jgi:hypothetical protein